MRYIYSAVFYLLLPLVVLRMLWRSRLAPDYRRRMAERLGFIPEDAGRQNRPAIWLHAVSVGESIAAAPLVAEILQRYPQYRLIVTTTTPTGSARVRAMFGDSVFHIYAPWDLPLAQRRFQRRIQPRLLLLMETELWPNMLHQCRANGTAVLLANARLSQRSAEGYQRFSGLTAPMLQALNCVAAQSAADAQRFLALGAAKNSVHITGSIKFDVELDASLRAQADALRQQWGGGERPVLVVASTHPGEDEQVLAAFATLKQSLPQCLLVLVPRHPERFGAVAQLCRAAGWQLCLRSGGAAPTSADDILLGDTMGELLLLLSGADVALIGGSLVDHGGHNMLEAAAWGVPVLSGPSVFNFNEISQLLVDAGAMEKLDQVQDLAPTLLRLMQDAPLRAQMGAAGLRVVAQNSGARERLMDLLAQELDEESITASQ